MSIIKDLETKDKRTAGLKRYECDWCKNVFEQKIRTSSGEKHSKGTDQVVCPKCKTFNKSK